METLNHFKIIIPFYNVEEWIKPCIRSVKKQEYKSFECILVDDMSVDNSYDIAKNEIEGDSRFRLILNSEKKLALQNIYEGIELSSPEGEDIILTLDGDDWLASLDVLEKVNKTYVDNNCWMTYGSYVEFPSGRRGKFAKKIRQNVLENNLFRDSEWCASHLRTFKHHLWSQIKKEDLLNDDGNFYKMGWDLAFMFPMLEMAASKSQYIEDILYVYNLDNPFNDHKVDNRHQMMIEHKIRAKKKYAPLKC